MNSPWRSGAQTDTLDLEGQVIAESDARPTMAAIEAVLPRFTGPIEQVPPAYSALKVGGERAYDLARKGEAVELAARAVTVHDLRILPGTGRGTAEGGGGGPPHPATSCQEANPPPSTLRAATSPCRGGT